MFKKIALLIVFVGVTKSLNCMEADKKPCLQLRAIQWIKTNFQKHKLSSKIIKPKTAHCESIASQQSPDKKQRGTLSPRSQSAFHRYETLILQAALDGDIVSLKRMLTPLPHKQNYFNKTRTSFNVNTVKTQNGESSLFLALRSPKASEVIKYLIEQGDADPLSTDKNNNSLLHVLAKAPNNFDPELLRYLAGDCKINPYKRNNDGHIPLHTAIQSSNQPMVKFYIENCHVDPKTETANGINCLDLATSNENSALITYLVKTGKMNPDTINSLGLASLFYAIRTKNPHIVRLLVEHGANFQSNNLTINRNQLSALDYAKSCRSKEAQAMFYYFMVQLYKTAMKENSKCTICHTPIQEGHPKKTFTSCCYQFICKKDNEKFDSCPLCKAKEIDYIVLKDVKNK